MNIYRVQMKDDDFFSNSSEIVACNISVLNGQVYFKTDKITINYLKQNSIKYQLVDNAYYKIKKNLLINKGIIFGILIFAFILFINQYRVSKIKFNDEFVINTDIENSIKDDTKKLLFWDFYTEDLDVLSQSLRKKYVNYQWISLEKKGSVINVTINNFDENSISKNDLVIGDIVAKKEGIIKYYTIYSGGRNVEVNKYVKQGDILISSDLLFNLGLNKKDLTQARGLVIANTYEEVTLEVFKEEKITYLGDKKQYYTTLCFFNYNININKKNAYTKFELKEKTNFNLFNFFKVKKIEETEKYDIIKTYNEEEAIKYVKSIIEDDFIQMRTTDLEKIEKIEVVGIEESKGSYKIKVLVKKLESIGEFKELNLNSEL